MTISGSAVGAEAVLLERQLARFRTTHPSIPVTLRVTPDAADLRHQLYAQWLNGRAAAPDILQLDVVWTAEFAAAGWITPLDRFNPPSSAFFHATVAPHRWRGALYALPWFADVGLLYYRTDLITRPPASLGELSRMARAAQQRGTVPFGFVWQGARYEGLVTVFLEYLDAFGGAILDADGRVTLDAAPAIDALAAMRQAIDVDAVVPRAVLGWQEEHTRFAFQNGQAVFMRNWPYARPLLDDGRQSRVAGRYSVAPMPGRADGETGSALGGAALALNAFGHRHRDAYEVMAFLLAPEQMLERSRVTGQFPTRAALYDLPALEEALALDPAMLRGILERAVARPVTPVYAELSEILQVALHRALSGQQSSRAALAGAARDLRALLARTGLAVAS